MFNHTIEQKDREAHMEPMVTKAEAYKDLLEALRCQEDMDNEAVEFHMAFCNRLVNGKLHIGMGRNYEVKSERDAQLRETRIYFVADGDELENSYILRLKDTGVIILEEYPRAEFNEALEKEHTLPEVIAYKEALIEHDKNEDDKTKDGIKYTVCVEDTND